MTTTVTTTEITAPITHLRTTQATNRMRIARISWAPTPVSLLLAIPERYLTVRHNGSESGTFPAPEAVE